MDSHLYFPNGLIHAPVPVNTRAFDVDAFNAQENDSHAHAELYATFPHTQAPLPAVVTFPTPSELMVDLASRDMNNNQNMTNNHLAPLPEELGFMQAISVDPHPSTMHMDERSMTLGMMGLGDAHLVGMHEGLNNVVTPGPVMPGLDFVPGVVTIEPATRPRRRSTMTTVSSTHGSTFVPTDPDTISSHEKKRHYLECIEQYIQYLHEQFELLGERPPDMERVTSYRGLSSRSIRTLLVHMEHNTRKLSERTRNEEQRFLSLRNEIAVDCFQYRTMSLAELTRNAFEGGLSAEKWLDLSRLLMSKSLEQTTSNLSNSVLILFRTYPGSPILQSYLHSALHSGLLPLPIFISTVLQAARSPELHVLSTLYTLLRTALEAHYTFGGTGGPDPSVVAKDESVSGILRVVTDALAVLKIVCGLVRTKGGVRTLLSTHDVLSAASELLVLLLASVPTDLSRVPSAQAIGVYNEMSDTLGVYQSLMLPQQHQGLGVGGGGLWADEHHGLQLVGVLETFLVGLSLVVGEDVRVAQAAAAAIGLDMGFGMNMGIGVGMGMDPFAVPHGTGSLNVAGTVPQQSSSDMDAVTLGLVLNHMVKQTSYNFGAGDTGNAVALLLAIFRSSSWSGGSNNSSSSLTSNSSASTTTTWTPAAFGTQVLLVALECLLLKAQQGREGTKLWKGFIVGRLPFLLASLVDVVSKDNSTNVDMRKGFQDAILTVFRRHDIFLQVEHALSLSAGSNVGENQTQSNNTDDESPSSRPLSRRLLLQLVKQKLISHELVLQIDPMILTEAPVPRWYAEAGDTASEADVSVYLESKLMHDMPPGEIKSWVERIWNDPGTHPMFVGIVTKRFTSAISSMDVGILGPTCKLLHTYDLALEIVALHTRICDLIFYSLLFLEEYDCEIVGDPQTAVSHLGDVVLFVQYALAKFKFENHKFTKDNVTVSTESFSDVEVYLRAHSRTQEDMTTFNTWTKALFDTNSEGIEDNILRATKPKILIRVALPLVSQAILASTAHHKFDKEVLMNGISYFTGPLLSWMLVGVIRHLIREAQQKQLLTPAHYEVIQTLILSPSCPRSVLVLCSTQIGTLVSDGKRQVPSSSSAAPTTGTGSASVPSSFNVSAIKRVVSLALGNLIDGEPYFATVPQPQVWYHQVQQAIQTTFSMARSQHKTPPHLDLRRCLNMVPPIKFLQILWTEIEVAANMGETEVCRRIATFILTTPIVDGKSTAHHYPLLPIFLHVMLPGVIAETDRMQPQEEQRMRIDLIVAVISSVLSAAMHLEWALRSVSLPDQHHHQHQQSGTSQSPAIVPVLGQSSNGMARRLALDLRRNRTSGVSKMILQRLAASHPFVTNFPVFKTELGTA